MERFSLRLLGFDGPFHSFVDENSKECATLFVSRHLGVICHCTQRTAKNTITSVCFETSLSRCLQTLDVSLPLSCMPQTTVIHSPPTNSSHTLNCDFSPHPCLQRWHLQLVFPNMWRAWETTWVWRKAICVAAPAKLTLKWAWRLVRNT